MTAEPVAGPYDVFRHEAFLYGDTAEFVDGVSSFLREGIAADEPALVVVSAAKIEALRDELGRDAERVIFADMAGVGLNPARIIPAWREFVAAHPHRWLRGVGEPIWAERTPAELVECQTHESLLNLAFAGTPAWWLLCPYDTTSLPTDVLDEAHRSHPYVMHRDGHEDSATYDTARATFPFSRPLPAPPPDAEEMAFGPGDLLEVRRFVAGHTAAAAFGEARAHDFGLAVNELATNSLRHGGGGGTVLAWREGGTLLCEVRDSGHISQALVGRRRPATEQENGWGVWLANQICDLVQIHSSPHGTAIRVRMTRA